MEARRLFSAAPTILQVTDGVAANDSFTVTGGGIDGTAVAYAPEPTHGAFEANFNGSGAGLNGPSDLVSAGGTGVLGTSQITNSIVNTTPFGPSGGNYLQSYAPASASPPNQFTLDTFTPTSAASSWNALTGVVSHNSINYLKMNGGFDLFVRADTESSTDYSWFRPVDISTISGATGMRLIFSSNASRQLGVEVVTGGDAISSNGTTFNSTTENLNAPSGTYFAPGQIEHVGFTFSTDANGLITMSVYAVTGSGPIDTTSTINRVATVQFYANADTIGANKLTTGSWSMNNRYLSTTQSTQIDYDSVRIYTTTPTTFAGLLASSTHATVEQTDNTAGTTNTNLFATALLPSGSAAGVYDVWTENAAGQWSAPVQMNEATPTFMSESTAYTGIKVEVAGRNMDQAEFGSSIAPQVRLVSATGSVVAETVTAYNPYDITFTASGTTGTQYFVEVSNDAGNTWSRLTNGQTLTMVALTGTDPLGLGVTWAQDFDWSRVYNAASYGANGSDTASDQTAITNGANALSAAGGGVLMLNAGTYYASYIPLPTNVVLEGASESSTILDYSSTSGGSTFIKTTATADLTLQGIADLTIQLEYPTSETARPDVFINLGGSGTNEQDRTASKLIVHDVDLSYPVELPTPGEAINSTHRGIGLMFNAEDDVLIDGNTFSGTEATITQSSVNDYVTIKNNSFSYACGYMADTADYAFVENNTVNGNSNLANSPYETHGIDMRSDAYVYDNTVENIGDQTNTFNDGEAIMAETPNSTFGAGQLTGATLTTATLPSTVTIPTGWTFGDLSVMVTSGPGVGQLRTIASTSGQTVTFTQPFSILPTTGSSFSLYLPNANFTVYDNTITDARKGIWLYGSGYEDVAADNTLTNCRGILSYGGESSTSVTPSYYARITGNTLTGVSQRDGYVGITIDGSHVANFNGFNFILALGDSVTNNSITGVANPTHGSGEGTEAGEFSGIGLNCNNTGGAVNAGTITGTLVENDTVNTVPTAFLLTGPDLGQLFRDNKYDGTLYTDSNPPSSNTIWLDNMLD